MKEEVAGEFGPDLNINQIGYDAMESYKLTKIAPI